MKLETLGAVDALEARSLNPTALPADLEIDTDTRNVRAGATFVALRGPRFDGHAFVAQAFERGAAACVVADAAAVPAGRAALVVGDTTAAYLRLARLARERVRGTVVAITGSTGKTTTKAYLLQLLGAAGVSACATPENENNEIGVSKFLLGLDAGDERVAIVEMGARSYGDIDVLVAATQPDIGVLTNVGDAHLEIMGSAERLARTKWGLFGSGARAVLNLADAVSRERASSLAQLAVWFGLDAEEPPSGGRAVTIAGALTLRVYDGGETREYAIDARVPGDHNRRNLAAALAGAFAAGVAPELLAPHVAAVTQPPGRYETVALAGGKRMIFDAYNASMSGTLATLAAFALETAERRIAVLGSMAELGPDAAAMHRRIGAAAANVSQTILAGGDFAADIVRGATEAGAAHVLSFADNTAAATWLQSNARPGDAILLKGSRKYKLEEIAAALVAASTA